LSDRGPCRGGTWGLCWSDDGSEFLERGGQPDWRCDIEFARDRTELLGVGFLLTCQIRQLRTRRQVRTIKHGSDGSTDQRVRADNPAEALTDSQHPEFFKRVHIGSLASEVV
jgi:hypothetical protein